MTKRASKLDTSHNQLMLNDDIVSYNMSNSDISNVYSIEGIDKVEIAGTRQINRKSILTFGIPPETSHPDELQHIKEFFRQHNYLRRSSTRNISGLQSLSGESNP